MLSKHACARRLSSLLATGPVRVREHCQLFNQLPIVKHMSSLSLAFQIRGKPFQLGKALLIGARQLLAQLVHDECYVCSVLTAKLICTCDAELDSMVPTLPLLSHQVLLVSARSCRAQAQGPSHARQRVWDRVDTRFLAFPSATSCSTF